jgi:tRNA (guanine37-N1)-methyltransferase
MRFDILSIFPELFASPLQEGIIRRALQTGQIQVQVHNIRHWADDKQAMTDDRPFGGGEGMVMKPEPLAACLQAVQQTGDKGRVILLSPRGAVYTQTTAERLAQEKRLVFICGRYEGVDERFTQIYVDEELSLGDYVLTGGELPALVVLDSLTRLLPGVLGCADSVEKESFSRGLLKHSQYTRPREFAGISVPEVLLSGDHARIAEYRLVESVRETLRRRPELLLRVEFSPAEEKILKQAGLYGQVLQARTGIGP